MKQYRMEIASNKVANEMLHIQIPKTDELPARHWVKLSGETYYVAPQAHVEEWFESNSIPMRLYKREYQDLEFETWDISTRYSFIFDNPDDAILFRLSWSDIEEIS